MKSIISVVIPSLNEEVYLPILLEDLENQKEKSFEVIVVDAKSDDQTKLKALSFSKKLNLTFIESPQRNLSFQRNLGAKHAQGDYLFFLDSDSRINLNAIKRIKEYIEKEKKYIYLLHPIPSKKNFINALHFAILTKAVTVFDKLGKAFALGPAIVIEKNFFESINGFDEKAYVSEDQNLVIKARRKGIRAMLMPDVDYEYSMRRFENENWFILMGKYSFFTFITLFRGAVYTDLIKYKMGGEKYKAKKINSTHINPLISVVIPAYNEEKLIGKCVQAAMNQTFPHKYEVLVIDNNSSDNTAQIALSLGATVVPFIEKQGFAPTKQFGVYQSKADIIAFTDADSVVDKYWLENVYSVLQDPELMCVGGTILPLGKNLFLYFIFKSYDIFAKINQLFGKSLIWGPNMAIR
ncbi:MAG TPA: glycosyltransferase, partial [Xanthomonadales bacterium]|nr:glycosyltransferase [Xanthomonadales bacterium]